MIIELNVKEILNICGGVRDNNTITNDCMCGFTNDQLGGAKPGSGGDYVAIGASMVGVGGFLILLATYIYFNGCYRDANYVPPPPRTPSPEYIRVDGYGNEVYV